MKKYFGVVFLVLILGGVFIWGLFSNAVVDFSLPTKASLLEATDNVGNKVTEFSYLRKKIESLPTPLIFHNDSSSPASHLAVEGVFLWTNIKRKAEGLTPLSLSQTLSLAGGIKVDDMFAKQYFEHVSPTGEDLDDVMKQAHYTYISVGENLALGNFESDEALVVAWMNSPGHRKNILSEDFTEIGISVKRGVYKGEEVWIAVQEFGRPLSECPYLDNQASLEIEKNKKQLDVLDALLEKEKEEIDSFTPKRGNEYNQKITTFNAYVAEYNRVSAETKILVEEYNEDVRLFNECIQ